jgi:hypothetical protein
MFVCQRLFGCFLVAIAFQVLLGPAANAQPTEVPLEKTWSSAYAEHRIEVQAVNELGWDADVTSATATGVSQAIASTLPVPLHAGASVSGASASGYGYNSALGGKADGKTSASCFRYLYVSSASGGPWASCAMGHAAVGEARWRIPASQTGNTWIQAKITLVGIGTWVPPENYFHVHLACVGRVDVGGTRLEYTMHDNGDIHVFGTLMDLDGPHVINSVFSGPVVVLTAREYISPGSVFTTLSSQFHDDEMQEAPFHLHTVNFEPDDPYIAVGILGTTKAESSELKAFIGIP